MTHYIEKNTATYSKTHATADAALAEFCAPAYDGAPVKTITMTSPTTFRFRGETYTIRSGRNPKEVRPVATAAKNGLPTRNPTVQDIEDADIYAARYGRG